MLFSLVFANRNLRRSTSLAPAALRPRHIPPRYEKSATATPLVPANYKCPLAQILSLHILTNAPGVWGSALSFLKFYLNSFAKSSVITCPSPLFSPFLFMRLHTLSFSVACKSFACLPAVAGHSYENCRVYTNNFHSGTMFLRPSPLQTLPATSTLLARRKTKLLRCRTSHPNCSLSVSSGTSHFFSPLPATKRPTPSSPKSEATPPQPRAARSRSIPFRTSSANRGAWS